jgi:hypothetical protein
VFEIGAFGSFVCQKRLVSDRLCAANSPLLFSANSIFLVSQEPINSMPARLAYSSAKAHTAGRRTADEMKYADNNQQSEGRLCIYERLMIVFSVAGNIPCYKEIRVEYTFSLRQCSYCGAA